MIKSHKWGSESSNDTKVMSGKHSTECEERFYLQIKKEKKTKQKVRARACSTSPAARGAEVEPTLIHQMSAEPARGPQQVSYIGLDEPA